MSATQSEQTGQSPVTAEFDTGDFASLLQREFKPKTDRAQEAVETAVRTLAEQALQGTCLIPNDVLGTIEGLIAALDQKLTEQINHILHHAEFQGVESAWRGLHYLVNNTETDESLKIRVMNISKSEAHKTLRKFKGVAWDQSPLFKKLYEEEYGQFGGEPYGAFVADYYFNNSAPDVELLTQMARVSAAAHCPLITAADPSVMLMESWQELANPRDLPKSTSSRLAVRTRNSRCFSSSSWAARSSAPTPPAVTASARLKALPSTSPPSATSSTPSPATP